MSELKPTIEESIRHFEAQQKRYVREHNGKPCPHYANAIEALRRAQPANEPLTLEQLREMLKHLEAECREADDGHEDYTNGYRWGHRNGQIELLRQILNTGEGTCESDRRKPEGSEE